MATDLVVPPSIEAVIQQFERADRLFDEGDVKSRLIEARQSLVEPSPGEGLGAWAELLAFALEPDARRSSPWNTYFGPVSSGTYSDGRAFYAPDIAGTEPEVIEHWIRRAQSLKQPILKARYSDLAWDMSRAIIKSSPDPEMARVAIDAYLKSLAAPLRADDHGRFRAATRALELALMLKDPTRTDAARIALLGLHRGVMAKRGRMWWVAIDRLMDDKRVGLTAYERDQLIADMESLLARYSQSADPGSFDPHAAEAVGRRLIKHYARLGKRDETKRINETIARAFEHFASLGNPMLASWALQVALNAYRDAGLSKESRRVRIMMEEKIGQSRDDMRTIVSERMIPKEDMEKFLASVVTSDLGSTFAQIAVSLLDRRADLEKGVQEMLEQAPLAARISQSIVAENRVAAKVGSVEDDPFGRLIRQATLNMSFSDVWLVAALERALSTHEVMPGHFSAWAARGGLYEDLTLVTEGVTAWFDQDYIKALHVLVPQIELALRGILTEQGLPTTKAHPTIEGVSVAVNLGDILYAKEIAEALGPDLTLYFQTLYADPRGVNLRNDIAHGLIGAHRMGYALATRVMHTLLILGLWKEIAAARR
jgi:hypothetical protein